jgi:hypothetical protein
MRILGGLGSVAVGLAVVIVFLFINGGYVYRTKCPLASGGTQTKWTYGIDDILPYIRSTSAPCKSHTGTRLLISAVGIAPLNEGDSTADAAPITPADQVAADALATAVSAISTEYDRERQLVAPLQTAIKSQGLTPDLQRRITRTVRETIRRYGAIKKPLDASGDASDAQLVEAKRLVSLYLALQAAANRLYFNSPGRVREKSTALAERLAPVVRRLQTLSVEIQTKYPNVTDWGFLPNS